MASSSESLAFAKYQGLGNDFLIVDLRDGHAGPSPEARDESGHFYARKLCDRRLGVGGDGVLTLNAPTSAGAAATMRVLNADGSEAEMCGNGLRCVAKYLLEAGEAGDVRHTSHISDTEASETEASEIVIDTGAGALLCRGHWQGGAIESVTVAMGRPQLLRSEIPMSGDPQARCLEQPYQVSGRELSISAVSMGNPHAVAFVPEKGEALMALAKQLGRSIEKHEDFPKRTNAEFAHLHAPDRIELVVWERGVGITQACGTGACATAVAACLAGLSECESSIEVGLPGGTLEITVAADYSQVQMRGPAVESFRGRVLLDSL